METLAADVTYYFPAQPGTAYAWTANPGTDESSTCTISVSAKNDGTDTTALAVASHTNMSGVIFPTEKYFQVVTSTGDPWLFGLVPLQVDATLAKVIANGTEILQAAEATAISHTVWLTGNWSSNGVDMLDYFVGLDPADERYVLNISIPEPMTFPQSLIPKEVKVLILDSGTVNAATAVLPRFAPQSEIAQISLLGEWLGSNEYDEQMTLFVEHVASIIASTSVSSGNVIVQSGVNLTDEYLLRCNLALQNVGSWNVSLPGLPTPFPIADWTQAVVDNTADPNAPFTRGDGGTLTPEIDGSAVLGKDGMDYYNVFVWPDTTDLTTSLATIFAGQVYSQPI